ncbi:MAG: hypothetical protein NUV90_02045 [Candidatus Parcubacteria bacterium]|nr:hypothetical protein [Candidatus Parcubacteria bacterium]
MPHRGVTQKEIGEIARKAAQKIRRKSFPTSEEVNVAIKQALEGKGKVLRYDIIHV